jgi:H+/gluconate symporter-like permease
MDNPFQRWSIVKIIPADNGFIIAPEYDVLQSQNEQMKDWAVFQDINGVLGFINALYTTGKVERWTPSGPKT